MSPPRLLFLKKSIRSFGLVKTLYSEIFSRVNYRTGYTTFECLTLPAGRVREQAMPSGAGLEVRKFSERDYQELSKNPEHELDPAFFREMRTRGGIEGFGIFAGGELAGYNFFATKTQAVDECLDFSFPPGWVYVFKALTLPRFRGRQVHAFGLLKAMEAIGAPLGYVTLIRAHNLPSLKSFERCGFRVGPPFRIISPPGRVLAMPNRGRDFRMFKQGSPDHQFK